MSEDPIGFLAGDGNLYRYVKNRSLSRVDPTGQYSSSGNSCEIIALNTYFQQLELDPETCEQTLTNQMMECDIKKRLAAGEELSEEEKAFLNSSPNLPLEEHTKKGKEELDKMKDKALKGY